ncbi:hypothetical protein Tco_0317292 [Tanacetum coccineum]
MGFDTHVWYLTSRKIPTSVNSSTWLWIASFLSEARLLFFCFTGSAWLNMFIQCLVLKVVTDIGQKDKNEAKSDKTGHENGKSVKRRSRRHIHY